MKHALAILALSLGISSPSLAADSCRDTDLYHEMENMRTAMRSLNFELRANNLAAAAEHAEQLRSSSQASSERQPFRTGQLATEQQGDFVDNYTQSMQRLLELIGQLQANIDAEDSRAAAQSLAAIDNHSRNSHRQFKARGCN